MTTYRKLLPAEYPQYAAHLLSLSPADRYSRFAGFVNDDVVIRHVDRLDWTRTHIIGAFAGNKLVGATELCTDRALWPGEAELALSVDSAYQGCGIGSNLMRRAMTLARNRAISQVHMLCLAQNRRILALSRRFGGRIGRIEDGEATIAFRLPRPTQFTIGLETLEDSTGIITTVLDTMQTARTQPTECGCRGSLAAA